MESSDKYNYTWVPTVLIVALAIFSFVLYQADREREKALLLSFLDERIELANKGLSGLRVEIDGTYSSLLRDCDERAAYDAYIDTDSRTMSVRELQDALRLHNECGTFFADKTTLTLNSLKDELDDMERAVVLMKDGKSKNEAEQLLHFWRQLYDLENEHATIYERMIDIQEEYWKADLNKASFTSTSEEREAAVGALNYEANLKLERIAEIRADIQRFEEAEKVYWNEHFSTSTKN